MLVGLTGRNASGKTTVVNWFSSKGVRAISCSDSIRNWLSEQGIPESRDSLIEGGRELRRRGGAGILAEMLLSTLDGEDAVIDSIRTPGEVEVLRRREDFILIEIRAGVDSRWSRSQSRGRTGDADKKETFLAQEKSEEIAQDDAGQALIATAKMADLVIVNDGDLDDLRFDLDDLWLRITKPV